MRDEGHITDEEFNAQKAPLLGNSKWSGVLNKRISVVFKVGSVVPVERGVILVVLIAMIKLITVFAAGCPTTCDVAKKGKSIRLRQTRSL